MEPAVDRPDDLWLDLGLPRLLRAAMESAGRLAGPVKESPP
jgi:hypothetical protein